MIILLAALFLIAFIGLRPRKFSNGNTDYLSKENTICVLGIFVVMIFVSHFINSIPLSTLGVLDKPAVYITGNLGQLMVAPFLFFSGYGIHQQYKKRGKEYVHGIPRNRILKVFLMFLLCWLLFAIVALYKNYDYSIEDYLLSIIGVRDIGNTGWYVFVILVLYLTSYVSMRVFHNHKGMILSQAILCMLFYVSLNKAGWGPHWYNTMLSYFLGICFSYWKDKFDKITKTRLLTIIALLFSISVLSIFFYVIPKYTNLNEDFAYACLNLFFDLSIVCFLKLFSFKSKTLTILGKNMFWIYMLQMLPIEVFKDADFIKNRYVLLVIVIAVLAVLVWLIQKVFNYLWNLFFIKRGYADENTNIKLGIGISYVALAASIIATLIVTPKILAAVGDEQYGLYSFVCSITSWLTVITSALATSYIRFATKVKKETGGTGKVNTLYFKMYAFFSLFIVIAMFAVVGVLYACNFKISQYTDAQNSLIYILLLISTINVAITILFSLFTHYLTFSNQFIFLRIVSLGISILTYACNLIFAVSTKSVVSIAIVATALSALSAGVTVFYAIRHQKMDFEKTTIKKEKPLLKQIFIFSSFILLNVIVDQIDRDVDKTLLGSMVDAKSVTIYTFAQFFNTYLLTLSISISGVFTPKVHELVENKDQKGLDKVFLDVSKFQTIIIVATVGGYIACGRPFIDVWLGSGYEEIYGYACVLLSIEVIPFTTNLGIEAQRAMNKHKFRAILYIALALINVGLSILFIKILPYNMAIWGAVFGTVFSVVVGNCIILNIYNKKAIGLPMGRYFINFFKIVFFAAVGVGAAIGISYVMPVGVPSLAKVFIYAVIFLVIYLGFIAIFERDAVKALINKFLKKNKGEECNVVMTVEKENNFDIICPVYNASGYLNKCINSVINQTYKNWKLYLIDDGSTDNSLEICKGFAEKFPNIVVKTKQNEGQGIARNLGMSLGDGEIIMFLDSDDFIDPNYLQEANKIISNSECDVLCHNVQFIQNDKQWSISFYKNKINQVDDAFKVFIQDGKIFTGACAKFIRRKFIETNKLTFPNFRAREDTYFLAQLFSYNPKTVFSNLNGYIVRIRENSTETSNFNFNKTYLLDSSEYCVEFAKKYRPELLDLAVKHHLNTCIVVALEMPKEINDLEALNKLNSSFDKYKDLSKHHELISDFNLFIKHRSIFILKYKIKEFIGKVKNKLCRK